jgi:para-nitrobenzyl esterase
LLVGSVLNEFVTGMDNPNAFAMTDQELRDRLNSLFAERTSDVIRAFRTGHPTANPFQLYSIILAHSVRGSAVKQAQLKATQAAAPSYLYWFTWQTPILDGRPMAFHCADLSFCWDNVDRCESMTGGGSRAHALAAKMSRAWLAFAKTGDPNHPGLPRWQPVSTEKAPTMIFDDACVLRDDPDAAEQASIPPPNV